MKPLNELAADLDMLPEEVEKIKILLKRDPNEDELRMYASLWSEQTSYKNSIRWLKTFPTEGEAVVAEAGTENAGLVEYEPGKTVVFKLESSNRMAAFNAYYGGANAVGGVNRDVFTLGALPLAQLNSIRVGDIKNETAKHSFEQLIQGLGDYSNGIGIPMIGGEVYFDAYFNEAPIVNVLSIGLVDTNKIVWSKAKGLGNKLFLFGSKTGKEFHNGLEAGKTTTSLKTIDSFTQRMLLEAITEMNQKGLLIAMQDLGAGGLANSCAEMAKKGKLGLDIDLSSVPVFEEDIKPWEVLLSETPERMLAIVQKGNERELEDLFVKWNLFYAELGELIEEEKLMVRCKGKLIVDVPIASLVLGGEAPIYNRAFKKPAYIEKQKDFSIDKIKDPENIKEVINFLIKHPNTCSKKAISEQFDASIGNVNMNTNFPSDASIINLKHTEKALLASIDGNPYYVNADPEIGAMIAVAESARNIICSGGKPLAVTNCLNFGNPHDEEEYWKFMETVAGIGRACSKFKTPVVSGDVSFYNRSEKTRNNNNYLSSPVIGMVGLLENKRNQMTMAFKNKGDMIYLIGRSQNDIASSQYLIQFHKIYNSPAPYFNLDEEKEFQEILFMLVQNKLVCSAHDVSEGGLYTALLESAIPNRLGFDITTAAEYRRDAFLFGEAQSRAVVSVSASLETKFLDFMIHSGFPFLALGHVTKSELRVDDVSLGFVRDVRKIYESIVNFS